eukprot:CAMPEP_0175904272 /NCGR_PEP_ID=MMETSP0108-20121206/4382_1 /TAXON_ID=195067 ORGANISM="Goniomonas pacifica, Strain CCMP1869" /NCGR_SAMPLE_ID=MMETSP0108 /ASSEMBLY_ACC=CAM_ASM_000204 /LENGTH=150 /DNA_ID=CAMNT_0017226061 /DNA_START=8 /DNA_END=463 /DNA_ORIENTATION=-
MSQDFERPLYTTLHGNSYLPAPLHHCPGHEFITADPQKQRDANLRPYNFKIRARETQNDRGYKLEFSQTPSHPSPAHWRDAECRALIEGVYQHGTRFYLIKDDPWLKDLLKDKTEQALADKWREISRHSHAGALRIHSRLDAFNESRRPY